MYGLQVDNYEFLTFSDYFNLLNFLFFLTILLYCFQVDNYSLEDKAAICIQAHFRGYIGRKKYIQLLYEQFAKVSHHSLHMFYNPYTGGGSFPASGARKTSK